MSSGVKRYDGFVESGIPRNSPEYIRQWQLGFRKTPEGKLHVRRMNLRHAHGLTLEEYDNILKMQGGGCGACGKKEETVKHQSGTINKLPVDHDHNTRKIRGILCHSCNRALGLLGDSVERLEGLLEYRRKF